MLQSRVRLNANVGMNQAAFSDDSAGNAHRISLMISAARRQMIPFIACALVAIALGFVYLAMATPLYTASSEIIIDNRQVRAVQELSTLSDSPALDTAAIESQVEVLLSRQVALAVLKQLKLADDPAFVNPPKSRIHEIWASILVNLRVANDSGERSKDTDVARQRTVLSTLERNLGVSRVGRTFVVQVEYTSPDPTRAAEIANGFANAYMSEQLNSRIEATRHARSWLQQRTEELRQLSVNADLDAQKFKADHNLLSTKGTLISEQQFNEMTSQLVTAGAATAQARARYLRIKDIIETHQTESAVAEYLDNAVINELRTKYLDASKRLSDFERKLGPQHIAVVNLRNTMDELAALLFQELARIAQSYKSDYEVAAAREKSLAANLGQQQGVAIAANDNQVQLRQLEQKAESYKTLYQSYMQRYQEAAQQESFPMSDAHVISAASPPLDPSQPRKPLVLAFSLMLGAAVGTGVGMLRESLDRVFRTVEQVRDEVGVEVLGMLPVLSGASFSQPGKQTRKQPKKMGPAAVGADFDIDNIALIMRYSIDHPFSAYAETLRSTRIAADVALRDRSMKTIGVVSLLPEEGKSTVAKNLASLLSREGARTLLIDADIRNPGLTRAIGCETSTNAESDASLPPRLVDILKCEPASGLHILPCLYTKDDVRVAMGLSSTTLGAILKKINQSYEYVIIDLPPIGPTVNARGIAPAIDAFIFVVEWGKTSRGAIRSILAKEHSIREKLLGAILNKVDMDKLDIYEHFGSDGYYHGHYGKYYNHNR